MQHRTTLSAAAAVVGVVVVAAAVIGLTLHKTKNAALPTPFVLTTPRATAAGQGPGEASPSPKRRSRSESTPAASGATTPVPTKTPAPTHAVRPATSVDCASPEDRNYCSDRQGMTRSDGRYGTYPTRDKHSYGRDDLTITMTSVVRKPDNSTAKPGDETAAIHVDVVVENKTDKTFVLPAREIVFEIYKDGNRWDTLETHGSGFDMTPQGKMTGTFDRPLTADGTYTWQAKTWYYAK